MSAGTRPSTQPRVAAPWLMLGASLGFATMAVCVKLAAVQYSTGEIVFYRGLIGALSMAVVVRWQGGTLRTQVPAMHFWRCLVGVCALCLWFVALGRLPLATAMTLNYMSSVWMALFLIGGSVMLGAARVDGRLVASVLVGFVGVALVLRPTIDQNQLWHGVAGLFSGVLSALAYLQVSALARAGEPEARTVFYFSIGGIAAGALLMAFGGNGAHTLRGAALLLAVGVLATAAQMMMTRAYAIGRTLSNAGLQYMGIVFSFIYGVLLFDETITVSAVAGVTLIIGAGLAATLLRSRSPLAPPDTRTGAPSDT